MAEAVGSSVVVTVIHSSFFNFHLKFSGEGRRGLGSISLSQTIA